LPLGSFSSSRAGEASRVWPASYDTPKSCVQGIHSAISPAPGREWVVVYEHKFSGRAVFPASRRRHLPLCFTALTVSRPCQGVVIFLSCRKLLPRACMGIDVRQGGLFPMCMEHAGAHSNGMSGIFHSPSGEVFLRGKGKKLSRKGLQGKGSPCSARAMNQRAVNCEACLTKSSSAASSIFSRI